MVADGKENCGMPGNLFKKIVLLLTVLSFTVFSQNSPVFAADAKANEKKDTKEKKPAATDINELLQNAEEFYSSQKYSEAITAAEEVVNKSTDRTSNLLFRAYYIIGWSYLKTEKIDKAVENLSKVLPLSGDSPQDFEMAAEAQFYTGECYAQLNRFKDAIEAYDKVSIISSYGDRALFGSAMAYYSEKQFDKAIEILNRLKRFFSEKGSKMLEEADILLIKLYVDSGKKDRAEAAMDRLSKNKFNPRYNEILFMVADSFMADKKYEPAIKFYQQVKSRKELLSLAGEELKAWKRKMDIFNQEIENKKTGDWLVKEGKDLKALYEKVKTEPDPRARTLHSIAMAYAELKDYEEANKFCAQILQEYQDDEEIVGKARILQTFILAQGGKVEDFAKQIDDIEKQKLTPEQTENSVFMLLDSFLKQSKCDEIIKVYEQGKLKFTKPDFNEFASFGVATSYGKMKQYDTAIKSLEAFLKNFPQSKLALQVQFNLAGTYSDAGRFEKAIEVYKRLSANPQFKESPEKIDLMVASVYLKKGDYPSAIKIYNDFLAKYRNSELAPEAAYKLGDIAYQQKDYLKAVQAYQQVIKDFPKSQLAAEAQNKIVLCYYLLKKYDDMVKQAETMIQAYPGEKKLTGMSFYLLGWNAQRQNQYQEAIAGYERLIKEVPESPQAGDAMLSIIQCYYTQKKYREGIDRALGMINSGIDINAADRITARIVSGYNSLKNPAEGEKTFNELLSKQKDNRELAVKISFGLAEIYLRTGNTAKALELIQSAAESGVALSANNYRVCGEVFDKAERPLDAVRMYLNAVEMADQFETEVILNGLGNSFQKLPEGKKPEIADQVVPVLKSLLEKTNSPGVALAIAEYFEGTGEKRRAAGIYRSIAKKSPNSSEGKRAGEHLQNMRESNME